MTRLQWTGLAAVVLLAAVLRSWGLEHNGFGNEYYSAGVRSMLESWHNLFFNAFDPAGFISLDKPPVAFWIQAASARILGFSGLGVLLPQVVEGTLSVILLCHLVRRRFGAPAGLLAALFLALTPVSVAVDRSTNTESCLVLVLLLSAWALSLAVERGRLGLLLLSAVLLGIGFNVKMLAALVVAPAFLLIYALTAPLALRRRLAHAAAGAGVLLAVSLSWSVVYDLTPAESRPYAGSSLDNSMLELAFDHNGLQRFIRHGRQFLTGTDGVQQGVAQPPDAAAGRLGGRSRLENVPAGWLRLVSPLLAGQVGWLLPLAAVGLIAVLRRSRLAGRLTAEAQAVCLWGGWLASYAAVFSGAGGIFHAYYLATMAPPAAALAAIGAVVLWRCVGDGRAGSYALPAAVLATAAWEYFVAAGFPEEPPTLWWRALSFLLVGGTIFSILLVSIARAPQRRLALAGGAIGLVAVLAMPTAWALSTVVASARVQFPVAGAWQPTPAEGPAARAAQARQVAALLNFLRDNRHGEKYLVAAPDARRASPLILASGEPVLALGGYSGADAILTPEALAQLVAQRALRFVMVPAEDQRNRRPNGNVALADWVRQNGRLIDPAAWRAAAEPAADDDPLAPSGRPTPRRAGRGLAPLRLYDLSPASPAAQ